jgi:hypothetical protein
MPVRETVSDGVPVGKKPQTGIEVKKSVGLANIQTTRSGGAARQPEVKFSQRSLRRARSQGNIQITFYLAARPQQEPEVKNENKKKRPARKKTPSPVGLGVFC